MLNGIQCLGHSSIKIEKSGKIMYIDPYDLSETKKDADIIFITHNHYDHYSEKDIVKIKKENTIIVVTEDLYDKALKLGFSSDNIIAVKPNENYAVSSIKFYTLPAYNVNKNFHPKKNGWVGYVLNLEDKTYYISGDTDITEENKKVKCDVAFVAIGGTYTMNYKEAAELINQIKPNITVPIHYGKIVGTKQDALEFKKLLNPKIACEILIK